MMKYPELRDAYNDKLARVEQNDGKVDDLNLVNARLNDVELILDKIEEHLKTNSSIECMLDQLYWFEMQLRNILNLARRNWWLCSAEFTVADISLAILLSRLYLLGLAQRFWSIATRPYLAVYYQRLNDRSSFHKVRAIAQTRRYIG